MCNLFLCVCVHHCHHCCCSCCVVKTSWLSVGVAKHINLYYLFVKWKGPKVKTFCFWQEQSLFSFFTRHALNDGISHFSSLLLIVLLHYYCAFPFLCLCWCCRVLVWRHFLIKIYLKVLNIFIYEDSFIGGGRGNPLPLL